MVDVSILQVHTLVKLASDQPEIYGARLTGGGFGGSIVALSKKIKGQKVCNEILKSYKKPLDSTPNF